MIEMEGDVVLTPEESKAVDDLVSKKPDDPPPAPPPPADPAPPAPPIRSSDSPVDTQEPSNWLWWIAFAGFVVGSAFLVAHVWNSARRRKERTDVRETGQD